LEKQNKNRGLFFINSFRGFLVIAFLIATLDFIIFSLNQKRAASGAFFIYWFIPKSKFALGEFRTGVKCFAFSGFPFNNFAFLTLGAFDIGGINQRFGIFAFSENRTGIEFTKAA